MGMEPNGQKKFCSSQYAGHLEYRQSLILWMEKHMLLENHHIALYLSGSRAGMEKNGVTARTGRSAEEYPMVGKL